MCILYEDCSDTRAYITNVIMGVSWIEVAVTTARGQIFSTSLVRTIFHR